MKGAQGGFIKSNLRAKNKGLGYSRYAWGFQDLGFRFGPGCSVQRFGFTAGCSQNLRVWGLL